jgi:hypothetical protein
LTSTVDLQDGNRYYCQRDADLPVDSLHLHWLDALKGITAAVAYGLFLSLSLVAFRYAVYINYNINIRE